MSPVSDPNRIVTFVRVGVGDGQVGLPVAIEIGGGQIECAGASREGYARAEGAVPTVVEHHRPRSPYPVQNEVRGAKSGAPSELKSAVTMARGCPPALRVAVWNETFDPDCALPEC